MCGRYALASEARQLQDTFDLDTLPLNVRAHYNIAPGQDVAVVRDAPGLGRHLDRVRWGLVPSWAKDARIGHRLINARAETVAEKPAFRAAYRRRRCLIPADGFYEWHTQGGHKQPYWIGFEDRRLFAFAGLWEHWETADGHHLESCAIITTTANPLVSNIHPRMPVILDATGYHTWLAAESTPATLRPLLMPRSDAGMAYHRVSTELNSPLKDNPGLLRPLA